MIKPTRKIFLYGLFTTAALGFFLYLRFPSDLIREILNTQIHKAQPELQLETETVSPIFPPGMKLEPVLLIYASSPLLRMDALKVTPHLLSLMRDTRSFSFKGDMGGGQMRGNADVPTSSNSEQTQININLSRVPLEFLEIVNQFQSFKTDGEVDAKISFDGKRGGGTADIAMEISQAHITLDPAIMGLETLDFTWLKAQVTLSARMAQIRSCDAQGEQLEGKITGSIVFRKPVEESRLMLSLTVKPQPSFIADHKNDMIGGLLASENAQRRGLVFRISGTFKNPQYVIR